MKKSFFLLIIPFLTVCIAYGQIRDYKQSSELGIFGGISFYRGDLNYLSNPFIFINPAGGLVYRYNFNHRLSLRANLLYGILEADDAETNSLLQQQRNLSFRSSVIEASGQLEFNYLDYELGDNKYPSTAYLFIGLGAFGFNPKANLNGTWEELQPLSTEGQGTALSGKKPYKRVQPCIPAGMGTKINLGKKVALGLEWGMRKTFTDYIDDVSTAYVDPTLLAAIKGPTSAALSDRSVYVEHTMVPVMNTGRQRGNSKNKDWYSFAGIILTFKISEQAEKCASY